MGQLAVVACHFNACGYKKRVKNFRNFARQFKRPETKLYIVELLFGKAEPELVGLRFANHIACRCDSVMWQKERLLNIGMEAAANDGHNTVCWMDADIAFEHKAWPNRVERALRNKDIVQMFSNIILRYSDTVYEARGVGYTVAYKNIGGRKIYGGGWAARRDFWMENPIYDRAIVGGGDQMTVTGMLCNDARAARQRSKPWFRKAPAFFKDWREWAAAYPNPRIGAAKGKVNTMPHGSRRDRRIEARWRICDEFDPQLHLELNEDKVWEWTAAAPDSLKSAVYRYFVDRKEDK